MKKLIFAISVFAAVEANAGAFTVFVRLPSGTIKTLETMVVPAPDKYGRYTFRIEKTTIIVDSSHVWIMSN